MSGVATISLHEGRFARLEAIEWWDQARLHAARVLVIGAGALGNEVLKNLALLGVGHVVIADLDTVELSNLSRSVLFRESDEGLGKAACAARAMRAIYPGMHVQTVNGNILADLGLGWFHWADVVVGALDNREARVFVNSACARVGRPWFDGGIEVLQGIVRGFHAARGPCYECTMSTVDWDLLAKRRSCSLLASRAIAQRGTPTTPTTASIIGALQAQEVVKLLHGMEEALVGRGFVFDGRHHSSYPVAYRINPDCPWHEPAGEILRLPGVSEHTPLHEIAQIAATHLGGLDALDLSREIVERMECGACGTHTDVWLPAENVGEDLCRCPGCGTEGSPRFIHSISVGAAPAGATLALTPRQIGLPENDILWARFGPHSIGLLLGAPAQESPSS